MKKLIYTSLLLLAACGGGADNAKEEAIGPLAEHYYGNWNLGDVYLVVSKDSLTLYSYSESAYCYEAEVSEIISSTLNSVETYDPYIDEVEKQKFEYDADNDHLILNIDGDSFPLSRYEISSFDLANACDRELGVERIQAELTFDYLPTRFLINREALKAGVQEIEYGIEFDINFNGKTDPSDIVVQVMHYKGQKDYPENFLARIYQLGGSVWQYSQLEHSEQFGRMSADSWSVSAVHVDNVITFDFDVTTHPLLALITPETPVRAFAKINYPSPHIDELTHEEDGPWNWQSDYHEDSLPDNGYLIPNQHNDMVDPIGDLTSGESRWADITSLTLTFQ
ncbi:hypothetical protein FE810_16740 [Thalassotalea litorea]|uniref:Uncharacterized protein n=1 Tax=Thalassotalea litorea TaxID=2020715 RepID=A0A5R9ILI6_9GAMM|nr:hypothetical protein [Thalassotalea litorea]TLU59509.1 hypothetical protein FE810_16740 [Thalassotalea litorea]